MLFIKEALSFAKRKTGLPALCISYLSVICTTIGIVVY